MPTRADRGAFAAFDNKQYRWLFFSNTVFMLAMQGQMLVRSMLTYDLTKSPFDLGLVSFAVAIPMFLMSPIGGVIADRIERRQLIIGGQAVLIGAECSILALYLSGTLQFWHLLCSATLMGCVFPLIMPAQQAIVVDVVGKRGLQNAMAISMGGMAATRILGPTIAGFLVAIAGFGGAYSFGLALYTAALLGLFGLSRSTSRRDLSGSTMMVDLVDGFRYVGNNRLVLMMLLFGILPMFLAMPFQSLLVIFTESIWNVGSTGLGIMYAVGGAGSLLGSVFVARLDSRRRQLPMMMLSIIGFGVFLFVFAFSPWFLLALPMVFIADIFASVFGTLNNAAVQVLIPDEVRGRISSFMLMSFSVTPMGTLPMAMVAEHFGAPVAVGLSSVLVIILAVVFYLRSASLRQLDRHMKAQWSD